MSAESTARTLWAPYAWLMRDGVGDWQPSVVLGIGEDGCWSHISAHTTPPDDAVRLDGPVLPGVVNAHSHAFQRAFAGLAEHGGPAGDDFWSWRDRMYRVAQRIDPDTLRTVATQLYFELLQGGYTEVCEFHYLHRAPDGSRYADPLAMSRALVEAACSVGIGLTLLPVLYERAGFGEAALRAEQRRFEASVDDVLAIRDGIRALNAPRIHVGVAIHSLRAAHPASMATLAASVAHDDMPVHIHVAEQAREVDECVAFHRQRPVEWLTAHAPLDRRWHLVHATHATPSEITQVAGTGAGIVVCPTTEANLGDGVFDLPRWLAAGVPLSTGSDSQVSRAWWEELRMLEYSQRLLHRRRMIAAEGQTGRSGAGRLFDSTLCAGGAACGRHSWGFEQGARADLLVADVNAPALIGIPPERYLDAIVFSSPSRPVADVMVAGHWRIRGAQHSFARDSARERAFAAAMHTLWP